MRYLLPLLFLVGCSTPQPPVSPELDTSRLQVAPQVEITETAIAYGTATRSQPKVASAVPIPVSKSVVKIKAFTKTFPADSPAAMVIFSAKPVTEKELKLFSLVCKSWDATFPTEELIVSYAARTFPTYWPIVSKRDCNSPDNYNYALADFVASALELHKSGPYLLAYYDRPGKRSYVTLDLALLEDEDIPRAFQVWKQELVVSESGDFSSLFSLTSLREKFRYFLNNYGNMLLSFK